MKRKAFTLMELLVVVVVIGVLAGVAIPKFTRVLETQRTNEAENILNAVRTEQEARCVVGKPYLGESRRNDVVALSNISSNPNYDYELLASGIAAKRGTDYTLKMWYQTGELCCEGSGCGKLNKDYPSCTNVPLQDECSTSETTPDEPAVDPCVENPNQEQCCYSPKVWLEGACVEPYVDPCPEDKKPATSRVVGTCVEKRTVSCGENGWEPSEWYRPKECDGCNEKYKPKDSTEPCGNCNKGTKKISYVCRGNKWEQQLSKCEILDSWCTPGTIKDTGGETCVTTGKNIGHEERRPIEADDRVSDMQTPSTTIGGDTVDDSNKTYTYNAGSVCTDSCTWQAKKCPKKGGGGGGGGGRHREGCCGDGTDDMSVRVVDFSNAACVGYVNVNCCTGEQSWIGGGGC